MQVAALYNLDSQAAIGNEVSHGNEKLLAKVSGISPNVAQPTEAQAHFLEELTGTSLIGNISRGDQDSEDESRGIHDHMPLSSHKFLSSIKATHSGVVSRFNTLRVDNRSSWGFFFPLAWRTASRNAS